MGLSVICFLFAPWVSRRSWGGVVRRQVAAPTARREPRGTASGVDGGRGDARGPVIGVRPPPAAGVGRLRSGSSGAESEAAADDRSEPDGGDRGGQVPALPAVEGAGEVGGVL